MDFKSYSRLNNIIGWLVFAIAAFTYLMTIEHTGSLWDCGEFVPCSYKMEVPHPPGAPFFILAYRFFTMFATDPKMVAIMTNSASALCSAFTILFLFWSITALAMKLLVKEQNNIARGDLLAILMSGAVGALAYTFSDTFWFSAVEGEVYAMSSMFTALIFWLALKWDRRANEKHHLRWMVLIFYMVGIVIGVHLLGLLVIPVVVLMYYYRKYKNITWKGVVIALAIGFVALGFVQVVTIQGLPSMASKVELMFVNGFGLPYWSGVIFFFALLFAVVGFFIYWSHKTGKLILNTILVCFISVVIGYLSYATSVIRSFANPPIDMNDPQDVFNLVGYLGREQYGENYITYGPYYTAYSKEDGVTVENGAMQYTRSLDPNKPEFLEAGPKKEYKFNQKYETFFPRMFNGTQDNYISGYRYWGNVKNDDKISFIRNNMRFFIQYQMRYMYWRYFSWNFIGRQNDIQGIFDEFHQGNWITGIPFIDEGIAGAGPQKDLPVYLKNNRARNTLFALPFILGLIGLWYQYKRDRRDFFVTFIFFFMTGLAIAIYLNMPSPQPRERDYAFVGSFYVFAIWIGLGVLGLYEWARRKMAAPSAAIATGVLCLLAVPTLMASQEWDDHDRSHRTASRDYGVDYLESCAPNAVLFTNGDNDTYPLWYAQEVEGIRTDVRIVNLSLFGTDWYINQMRIPINKAPGLKFTLKPDQTMGWDYIRYEPSLVSGIDQNQYIDVRKVMEFIGSKDKATKAETNMGDIVPFMPTKHLRIMVDKKKVIANGTVRPQDTGRVVDHIDFELKKSTITKSDLMVLDFIATNGFDVPVYFSITSGPDEYLNLGAYLQQEGLAYRLVPVKGDPTQGEDGNQRISTDLMYNNIMHKFVWGGLDKNTTLVDYVLMRESQNIRGVFQKLCRQLIIEGKNKEAIAAADKCLEVIPERNVPYDFYIVPLVEVYYRAGARDKGSKLGNHMADLLIQELNYYTKVKQKDLPSIQSEIQRAMIGLQTLLQTAGELKDPKLEAKIKPEFERFMAKFPPPNQEQ